MSNALPKAGDKLEVIPTYPRHFSEPNIVRVTGVTSEYVAWCRDGKCYETPHAQWLAIPMRPAA